MVVFCSQEYNVRRYAHVPPPAAFPPPHRAHPSGSGRYPHTRAASVQKIDDDLAGRSRLDVVLADGRTRIDDHDRQTRPARTAAPPLPPETWSVCSARSCRLRKPASLRCPASRRAECRAPRPCWCTRLRYARIPRNLQQLPRALDIGAIEFLRIVRPEPIIGGHMVECITSAHRLPQRVRVRQVADRPLDKAVIQRLQLSSRLFGRARTRIRSPRAVNCCAT